MHDFDANGDESQSGTSPHIGEMLVSHGQRRNDHGGIQEEDHNEEPALVVRTGLSVILGVPCRVHCEGLSLHSRPKECRHSVPMLLSVIGTPPAVRASTSGQPSIKCCEL